MILMRLDVFGAVCTSVLLAQVILVLECNLNDQNWDQTESLFALVNDYWFSSII